MKIREGSQMLGAAELGALLGVSRQRVTQLTGKEWFPKPMSRLAMGGLWELIDIERMVSGTGRTLNYPALEAHLTAIEERHRTGGQGGADAQQ